jgi:uncharacterized phiE125 gp8 family phage protein
MGGRLKRITPPAVEPVLPADLRTFGRISTDVADATLTSIIKMARELAENYQNRAYITQTWELIFDEFPALPLDIPLPPLVSLVSVNVTDIDGVTTAMTLTDFTVDTSGGKGRIFLKYGEDWPSVIPEYAGVVFRFTCGYGSAGASVPSATLIAIELGALWIYDHPGEAMTEAFYRILDPERVIPA